ncbi:MAG TPA: IS1182 family transposase [Novosphingobium sp.]|nr:IS1182 family transposase [Novosphingobium sp.]
MSNFRPIDRATPYLLPPSVEEWLPEDHLARFVVEIVDQLDLSALERAYRGSGKAAYHPAMLTALLIYGYATGTYSSRAIEKASHDSVAFRYIAANQHPDHDTLCAFRRRFLKEIEALFVQVLQIAGQMKLLKLGTVALDGTKIHANASRHNALSYARAQTIETQLHTEVRELLARAEAADRAPLPAGLSVPEELARREARLAAIAEAKAKIEARATDRHAEEQRQYEAKVAAREAKAKARGKRPGGRPPTPPSGGVRETDQINLTDEESRIMPRSGGGFEQCYNAQAAVDTTSMLIVGARLSNAPVDARQLDPMLDRLALIPEALGRTTDLLADAGFFSQANVERCRERKVAPLIARRRDQHYVPWLDRLAEPPPFDEAGRPVDQMLHRLQTRAGRALYGLRKQTVEPVFGIIKSVMRFRQFLLRGLQLAGGEWNLVAMAWNIRRMAVLAA